MDAEHAGKEVRPLMFRVWQKAQRQVVIRIATNSEINHHNSMKTLKTVPVELVRLVGEEFMPEVLEFGKLYYSEEYQGLKHLCLCGCGHHVWLPIKAGEWSLSEINGKVSITPSVLQRFDCRSHYIITNGKANFV
jgi:hypothetical protein